MKPKYNREPTLTEKKLKDNKETALAVADVTFDQGEQLLAIMDIVMQIIENQEAELNGEVE